MRSAIYFPDVEINCEATMRSALLMWDEIKVIVPWDEFRPEYKDVHMAEAWELIGGTMYPDDVQKHRAHENIKELIQTGSTVEALYRDDAPPDGTAELWPQKLLPETWELLREHQFTSAPLANGDYPFQEQSSLAVMAKLADACAGSTFARWTDRFLAYGLVADRDPATALQTAIIPITLSAINVNLIPIEILIDFRRRELTERGGCDYQAMRHRFTDALMQHLDQTKRVDSTNELNELRRQFKEDTRRNLQELSDALRFNVVDTLTSPFIVSAIVATGSWLALQNPMAALVGGLAGSGFSKIVEGVTGLFHSGSGYNAKQRETLAKNPMAYLYQLSRVQ